MKIYNNEDIFDITKVRFYSYLQEVKESCEGYVADSMSALYKRVAEFTLRWLGLTLLSLTSAKQ